MLLSCRNISKSFVGARALDDVNLDLAAGEIHGIVGANGAGKSTLMKILAGALLDHEGEILLDGRIARLASPHEALAQGVAMVYQELSGVGALSVAENLFLGRQPRGRFGLVAWREMRRRARDILARVGLGDIDVSRRLDAFPLAARQLVEIARGLEAGSRVIILDEPTSALSPPETRRLFDLIRQLRAEGKGVIFVSHFIEDVLEICDRVTALVGGRVTMSSPAAGLSKHEVIEAMLGGGGLAEENALEGDVELPPAAETHPILEGRGLTMRGRFAGVDIALRPGETLGVYGFVGAGHQELAHAMAGALPISSGEFLWDGRAARIGSSSAAVRLGIALVAADRASTIVPRAEIYKNVTLAHLRPTMGGWLARGRELAVAGPFVRRVGCNPNEPRAMAGALSGGNQQKVALAKWLLGPVRALILEEPTRGMDVGAKREIMELVRGMKRGGAATLLATSEPELALAHADRIIVMRRGVVTAELAGARVGKADLLRHA